MDLPSATLYLEDFYTDYENQVNKLLDFYEMAPVINIKENPVEPPYTIKDPLFKDEDKIKVKQFIKKLASPVVLELLDRYLVDIPDS